jgi:hypothetical protein
VLAGSREQRAAMRGVGDVSRNGGDFGEPAELVRGTFELDGTAGIDDERPPFRGQ